MASDAAAAATPAVTAPSPVPAKPATGKRRGSYNCGRCGQPKKGHVCSLPGAAAAASTGGGDKAGEPQSQPPLPPPPPPPMPMQQQQTKLRRALKFDDPAVAATASVSSSSPQAAASAVVLDAVPLAVAAPRPRPTPTPTPQAAGKSKQAMVVDVDEEEEDGDGDDFPPLPWVEVGERRRAPGVVLMEVLRRLTPRGLAAAAGVSRGWRECVRHIWGNTQEVRLRASGVKTVEALMARCPALTSLVLAMDSGVDATLLPCISFNCPNLQSLDIMVNSSDNRITGDQLSSFVSKSQSLSVLKLNGCSSLGFLNVSSSSLSTLWISGLCSLTKAVMNCPNLNELSLHFPVHNNDSTDLVALMDSLGRTCPNLRAVNISSIRLCNEAVIALASANLRGLCMLSLVGGSKITDAAVASIVRSYTSLELLDLTGSGITDNGIWMISTAFPNTLTHLRLAMCQNINLSGVNEAAKQLPLLRLMDCGKSICATPQSEAERSYFGDVAGAVKFCSKLPVQRKQPTQLIIKHNNLKKLSLWGCSGISALYVNCPELVDLNLNSCTSLHPEALLIQCPKLKDVHVMGCSDMLIGAIRSQILNEFAAIEPRLPCKRLADGSKRVHVPHFMIEQLEEPEKWGRPRKNQCTVHLNYAK